MVSKTKTASKKGGKSKNPPQIRVRDNVPVITEPIIRVEFKLVLPDSPSLDFHADVSPVCIQNKSVKLVL